MHHAFPFNNKDKRGQNICFTFSEGELEYFSGFHVNSYRKVDLLGVVCILVM